MQLWIGRAFTSIGYDTFSLHVYKEIITATSTRNSLFYNGSRRKEDIQISIYNKEATSGGHCPKMEDKGWQEILGRTTNEKRGHLVALIMRQSTSGLYWRELKKSIIDQRVVNHSCWFWKKNLSSAASLLTVLERQTSGSEAVGSVGSNPS